MAPNRTPVYAKGSTFHVLIPCLTLFTTSQIFSALFHQKRTIVKVLLVLVPSLWTFPEIICGHLACLSAYVYRQTSSLVIHVVHFQSSVVVTVSSLNKHNMLPPSTVYHSCMCTFSARWGGLLYHILFLFDLTHPHQRETARIFSMLGILHLESAGAAAEQPNSSSMWLSNALSLCILTFRHFWSSKC